MVVGKTKHVGAMALSIVVLIMSSLLIAPSQAQAVTVVDRDTPTKIDKMFKLLNQFRAKKHLKPVKYNANIAKISSDWTAHMVRKDNLYHNPNYYKDSRLPKKWRGAGEIIAYSWTGSDDVDRIFKLWVNSPPHNKIMSSPNFNTVGIGISTALGKGKVYSTINFYEYKPLAPGTTSSPYKYKLVGAIGNYYAKHISSTGNPTSNERKLNKPAGAYQNFSKGKVYYSSKTGAHLVKGSIFVAWKNQRYEKGKLGFPTTDEYKSGKLTRQNYQHGYITWKSGTKAKVTYK